MECSWSWFPVGNFGTGPSHSFPWTSSVHSFDSNVPETHGTLYSRMQTCPSRSACTAATPSHTAVLDRRCPDVQSGPPGLTSNETNVVRRCRGSKLGAIQIARRTGRSWRIFGRRRGKIRTPGVNGSCQRQGKDRRRRPGNGSSERLVEKTPNAKRLGSCHLRGNRVRAGGCCDQRIGGV
eukprot:scaffold682_cov363-Pavlova_lutheri.AAC.29